MRALFLALLLAMPMLAWGAGGLAIDGTQFVLTTEKGAQRRSEELVGAELDVGELHFRIEAVRQDPDDPLRETLLHQLQIRDQTGAWQPLCEPDREGKNEAIVLAGRWTDGRFYLDNARFSISCTNGARAKCVRFGYKPWKTAPNGSSLLPAYEACIHMVRADYCGDGVPATRDGTPIDVYDVHRVQRPQNETGFAFEAGWSPEGAVCVRHSRIPTVLKLDELVERCPRLSKQVGDFCTEAWAKEHGAIVFNLSRGD